MIDTDCTTCDGLGTLGLDPDTNERIYCDGCVYGVTLHLEAVRESADGCSEWLRKFGGSTSLRTREVASRVRMRLGGLTAEYDDVLALLDTLKQDETNRPRALLFEDL